MDGWITIGTQLSTDKFDKQMASFEKKLQNEEEKIGKYSMEIDIKEDGIKKAEAMLEKLPDKVEKSTTKLQSALEKLGATKEGTPEFENVSQEIADLSNEVQLYTYLLNKLPVETEKQKEALERLKAKQSEATQKAEEYKKKIEEININKHVNDVNRLKNGFKGVNNNLERALKTAGRFALSIIGIRSAMAILSRASSELASYDEQYATDLEYIRYVLAQAIAPILKEIIQLGLQLLQIIGMITQALFGVNIFANGSAENFQKMKAGASGTTKAVKELKKQLMGFDEVNVVTDQSDTGTSGGAGGVGIPSLDISDMQAETPEWMKWIVENSDELVPALLGIAGGILAIKLGLGGLKALGIGLIITGLTYAIEKIIEYSKDPSLENFGSVLQGIGLAIMGLGLAIANIFVFLAGAGVLLYGTIIKYWEDIRRAMQEPVDAIREEWGPIGEYVADIMEGVLDIVDIHIDFIEDNFGDFLEFLEGVFTGDWEKAWKGLEDSAKDFVNFLEKLFDEFLDTLYNLTIRPITYMFDDLWDDVTGGADDAWDGIEDIFGQASDYFKNTFRDAWNKVLEVFDNRGEIFNNIKDGVINGFKWIVNSLISGLNQVIAYPFNSLNYRLSQLRQVDIAGIRPFSWIGNIAVPQIPYLKKGAILNVPNKRNFSWRW